MLWDCVLSDYRGIDRLQSDAKHEANYWPIVLEEYFRYLQQLYRPGENKKAYSCMHQKVIDAPVELRRIRDANPAYVTLWEVAGAGHVTAGRQWPDEYRRRVLAWFDACYSK